MAASITPVTPPIMNRTMKASTNSSGVLKRGRPIQSVASQQKNWIPVGIAIIALAAVKKLWPSCGIGVANMWWTQRPKPRKPVATIERTIAV